MARDIHKSEESGIVEQMFEYHGVMPLPLTLVAIDDLDPTGVLGRAEAALETRRAAEVEDLLLVLRWADLHGADPRTAPNANPSWIGQDRLVDIGGEGTPQVQELCLPELAIARRVHTLSARAVMADALDLRHRLPRIWAVVRAGECEPWLARKVAATTRALALADVGLVDSAVAAAISGEAPSRVLGLTEAKVIEADLEAHRRRLEEARRRRLVAVGATRDGARTLFARLEPGDAAWVDAMVDRVADLLRERPDLTPGVPDDAGKDELRAVALGWLAHPAAVLDLLENPRRPAADQGSREPTSPVVLYLHLHQAATGGTRTASGVVRPENLPDLGPLLTEQLRTLLAHSRVTVKPVIDLRASGTVSAYEFPEAIRERVHLRHPGEVFPHASGASRASHLRRREDLDHVTAYDPTGPPGQTGDHNAATLGRTHHRAKTHLGYQVTQSGLDRYTWTTPHGLRRSVGPEGTRIPELGGPADRASAAALDLALDRILTRHLAGTL